MKVSELIVQLKELKEAYGNLDVKSYVYNLADERGVTEQVVCACVSVDEHGRDFIEIN